MKYETTLDFQERFIIFVTIESPGKLITVTFMGGVRVKLEI